MNIPTSLTKGDKVAIVATAKRLESDLSEGIRTLESWGLNVQVAKSVHRQSGYFAGMDDEKIFDVQSAINDPSIKAIVFARGGYGTTRILDQIDFNSYLIQPKWLVGFSDLTSILLQSCVFDIPSIHGPVGVTIGKDHVSDESLKDLLFGKVSFEYSLIESPRTIDGECAGKIVGGNLSLVCESIGAANEIETDGNILFLEEIGEAKYSIDRMMNKLKRIGKLDGLTGAVIGSFSNISDGQSYFEESTEEIIMGYLSPLNIPVAVGLEAGHVVRNRALMLGADCEIAISRSTLSIDYLK